MPHSHPIYDSDKHFVIDPITRNITNNSSKLTIMQYDHNSERFTFEIPRVIEGHDMSLSNAVRVNFINIGSIKTNTNSGVYEVDDVKVSSDNPDIITFSWLISGAATRYNGSLNFAIRFYCISDESIIEYSWGTNIYSGIKVSNSLDNSEAIAEDYVDVLEKWKQDIMDNIPTKLPNPNPLTFTGAASGSYDGSEAINIKIPEQVQPDWNQNDNTQPDYVKNRPFYNETKTVTVENVTDAKLEGFPAFVTGNTVTVNVDGVEHSLVAYYDEDEGVFTIGDIYSDLENGKGQLGWQIWCDNESSHFYATEAHTVSYLGVFIYKIDNKFINTDGLVRTYNYYFNGEWLYKTLYNSAGDSCTLYTCSDFILPDLDSQLFGFMSEIGFSKVNSVSLYSCFITGFIITTMNAGVRIARIVLGTDTSDMETMAADNGYTYTTKPNK